MKSIAAATGMVLLLASAGCDRATQPSESPASPNGEEKHTERAPDDTMPKAEEEMSDQTEGRKIDPDSREEYIRRAEEKMAKLEKKIAELQQKLAAESGAARDTLSQWEEKLKTRLAESKDELAELKTRGSGAWNELQKGFANAFSDLRDAYQNAVKEMETPADVDPETGDEKEAADRHMDEHNRN